MNGLYRIVRRIHCQGTHQRFAVDALPYVTSDAGKRLCRWLLYYHSDYLRGAVDPDIRFRDFHNHVLHVRDGFWGGAPRVAHQWYERLQKYLRAERFSDAAHAAGVLTHYLTDVIQPLHTVSTEREGIIHRPLEWSIDRAYDRIVAKWKRDELRVQIRLSDEPNWLGALMMHSAAFAERRCDEVVGRYSLRKAVKQPAQALDTESIVVFSELFALAIHAIARVFDRSAMEVEAFTRYPIPECRLGWGYVDALVASPVRLVRRPFTRIGQTIAIRALAKEYFKTGALVDRLPAEVDIKRRVIEVHAQERLDKQRRETQRLPTAISRPRRAA